VHQQLSVSYCHGLSERSLDESWPEALAGLCLRNWCGFYLVPFFAFSHSKKQGLFACGLLLVAPEQRKCPQSRCGGASASIIPYVVTIKTDPHPAAFAIPIPHFQQFGNGDSRLRTFSHLFTSNCSIAWEAWIGNCSDLGRPIQSLRSICPLPTAQSEIRARWARQVWQSRFAVKVTRLDPKILLGPRKHHMAGRFWANGQAPFSIRAQSACFRRRDTEVLKKFRSWTHVFQGTFSHSILQSLLLRTNYSATKIESSFGHQVRSH
jgi:hypothetical protein